ncbi:alkaline phosphatase PhoX [uncultured Nitrosomonas sp.]|uniref:alkaline phosphatase PhoX n=1 Tax=uncultured Nitrosomonas sp. TaxID=156424 RepID=UPI0025FE4041|nr:alkaline phosphatase PhoX [uncultured Nitrosomonas sp.]
MNKSTWALPVCAVLTTWVYAEAVLVDGLMSFKPITASAYEQTTTDPFILNSEPWVIPKGFTQHIISDERHLDIYPGANDLPDMNTVNETGKYAGRYLYRTHEVRPGLGSYAGGAVSIVDLETGKASVLAQRADWEALDGLVWTPWQTLLFAEEMIAAVLPDPDAPNAESGMLYEMIFVQDDPATVAAIKVRPMLGSLSHEGIEIDDEGNVYVIDETETGSIYKFVPDVYGDLSSGQLYALRVKNGIKTGVAEWVALDMNQVQTNARIAAQAVGATSFCRPEDLERIKHTLFAALTCEDATDPSNSNGPGAILSIKMTSAPVVSYFVQPGVNVPYEVRPTKTTTGITGFMRPDNLTSSSDGKLWIVEDNENSDIWVALPDEDGDGFSDGVYLFASLKDAAAEGTGIYFGKDPHTLFVNIQHSGTGNDKTMIITNKRLSRVEE